MGCGKTRITTPRLKEDNKEDSKEENLDHEIIKNALIRRPTKSFVEEYQNGNKIGTGGFAEVRRCTHKLTGYRRAVKIYYKDLFPAEYLNSGGLFHEIEIWKIVDHPNIVKVYEYFEDEKCFYITMEFCLGGELFKKIGGLERLTESVICDVMRQLFSVVSYMHSQRIVHRDIKPENILIEERGEELHLKIADFGNAILLKDSNKMKGETGTSYYMAPEVIDEEYTEKCDEWSCGVIMYMLLTGSPPFSGENDEIIIGNVKKQEYSLDGPEFLRVSEDAKDLIKKLLLPEELRLTASEALNHRWFDTHSPRKIIKQTTITSVTKNLKSFKNTFRLKESIKSFIISQIISLKDTKEIRDVFQLIDKDNDGKISKDDLIEYFKLSKNLDEAIDEAEQIIDNLDFDKKGYIEYSQYLKASLDTNLILSKNNVTMAFNMLDPNRTGFISAESLMQALSEDQTNINIWKKIIKEVSKNKDGMINLEEFISMIAQKM